MSVCLLLPQVQAVAPKLQLLSYKLLPQLLWACASLSYSPEPPLLSAVLAAATAARGQVQGIDCSQLLWSMVKLGCKPSEEWLEAWVWTIEQVRMGMRSMGQGMRRRSRGKWAECRAQGIRNGLQLRLQHVVKWGKD